MPAKKKKTAKKTKKTSTYQKDRDEFYKTHPNARVLLGLFIVATAILVTMIARKQYFRVEVTKYLFETEGIEYVPD